MNEYERICDFQNLYKAHKKARLGKQDNAEVIAFEMDLSRQLSALSDALRSHTYHIAGYYSFVVHDPKERVIHALHYPDRVVQHCLCDEVLEPLLDRRLVYNNAACRKEKGTHFALKRMNEFLHSFYHEFGTDGFFLKCDIRKFFDSIDHDVLKRKLLKAIEDSEVLSLLYDIIDSFETLPGKGLPMGNQTSQWFALYCLDGFDRLVKEKLHIRYYSRYMDDCVLIHHDREYLKFCLKKMRGYLETECKLEFNNKTQIFPVQNGVDYLGWHFYLTETGKVIRKLRQQTKRRYQRNLQKIQKEYMYGEMTIEDVDQVLAAYQAHLSYGHTFALQEKMMEEFVLVKKS